MILCSAGFKLMIGWECIHSHDTCKVILSAYADDFKMAGNSDGMRKAWGSITGPEKLALDPPTPFDGYLGVAHTRSTITRAEAAERVQNIHPLVGDGSQQHLTPKQARGEIPVLRWHMEEYWQWCVGRYEAAKERTGLTSKFKPYAFPPIDDHRLSPEDFEKEGVLSIDALDLVM